MVSSVRKGAGYAFAAIVAASLLVMALGYLMGAIYRGGGVALLNANAEAQLGFDYFRGTIPLKNRGPPCGRACHQISNIDIYGGSIGPDLSDIVDSAFSGNATRVTQFLHSPTTPTMWATWRFTPLTDREISAIVELLRYAAAHSK